MLQLERGWRHHIAAVRATEARRKTAEKMAFIEAQIVEMQGLMKLRVPITAEELDDLSGPKSKMFRKAVKSRAQALLEDMDEHEETAKRGTMAHKSSAMTVRTLSRWR